MIDVLSYRQWAISQQFANSFGLMALGLLSRGKSIEHLIKKRSHEDILNHYALMAAASDGLVVKTSWDSDARLYVSTTKNGQNVAMIPVMGALTKRGDLCSYGMRDYIGMIDRANKSDKVAAILLDVESPGGTVDGTNEFGMSVKSSAKPIVAFGDGMVASAAYWVASQAREIIANKNNATEFGSIGVLYIHENYQAYIQKEIGSVEIIRAPQSVDKARVNVIEPLSDDQRLDIRAELKDIAKEFISTVKKGRGARLQTGEENIFTGKMYPAGEAQTMGMIDSMDTLQGAINRAGQLANNQFSTSSSTRAQVNTNMFKSKTLSSIFGKAKKAEEKEKSAADIEAENLQSADEKAAELEAENTSLTEKLNAAETRATAAEAKVSELSAQVNTLTTEKTTLETEKKNLQTKLDAAPAGAATTVIESKDPKVDFHATSVDAEKKKYQTPSK